MNTSSIGHDSEQAPAKRNNLENATATTGVQENRNPGG